jgi:hypothetical protein
MPISGSYFYPGINTSPNSFPVRPPITVSLSSTFLGEVYAVVLGPVDISHWSNWRVSLVNNSVNNLKSGSVDISPDGTNWVSYHTASFSPLTSSGWNTYQASGVSVSQLRVRAWPSGSDGGLSGSVNVILNANN